MDINELETYRLADAVKFNKTLNPKLWGSNEQLLPPVRDRLLAIADDFREFLGISDLEVKDITISGSNAAYTYTEHSDIDLHLVVDLPRADASEVYRELFDAKKYQYNDQHNFTIGVHEVELYVQNANDEHVSQGIYSVINNDWVRVPRRSRPDVDDISVRSKYQDLAQRVQQAIQSGDLTHMDALAQKINNMRKTGLATTGEFGPENLAFKVLRNNGTLQQLRTARQQAKSQAMSLSERKKKKAGKKTRWGQFGGLWFPGYHNIGQPNADTDTVTPADIGGESVKESVDIKSAVKAFAEFCSRQLSLDQTPALRIKRDPAWSERNGTFGQYNPDANTITLSTAGRHPVDIMRTLAHELVHSRQNNTDALPAGAGATGSKWEDQANAVAGQIMRAFAKKHPEYFDRESVTESSGYIPVNKKEAGDPRYSMAVTADIQPGEPRRQAAKLGFKTDAAGRPPVAKTNGLVESLTQRLQAIKEGRETLDEQELEEVAMSPGALRQFASSSAAAGMQAGFEAELVFRGLGGSDDEEMEPDYDMDRVVNSIDDVIDFFNEGPYSELGGIDETRIRDELLEEFFEWNSDRVADAWNQEGLEYLSDYIKDNDEFDQEAAEEQARESLGPDATEDAIAQDVQEQFDEFVSDVYNEGFDSRIYERAREQYEDEQRDEFDMEYAWLNDQDYSMSDMQDRFRLQWPYLMGGPDAGYNEANAERLADDMAEKLGVTTVASGGYHQARRDNERWIFEPDSSLDPDDSEDLAIEIVSPPMPLQDALEILPKFFAWAAENGAYANKTTGFHMSVSMPDHSEQQLDYVKLALFLGDEYVLKQFGRSANTYAASAVDKIRNRITADNATDVLTNMRKQLNQFASRALADPSGFGKYVSINPKGKYIEFRSAGGGDYFNDIDRIQNTLMRYARATAAAMDPAAEKQEYAKKLYKLLTAQAGDQKQNQDTVWLFSRYAAGELPKSALLSFVRQAQQVRTSKKAPAVRLPPDVDSGNYEIYGQNSGNRILRFQADSDDAALAVLAAWKQQASPATFGTPEPVKLRVVQPDNQQGSVDTGTLYPFMVTYSIGGGARSNYRVDAATANQARIIFVTRASAANLDMPSVVIHGVEQLS